MGQQKSGGMDTLMSRATSKTPASQNPDRPLRILRRPAWLFASFILIVNLLQGCAINPVSGEREFSLISEEQEIAMGREGAADVARSIGLVDDTAMQAYVQRIGAGLASGSERPKLSWSFQVIDDPNPNAFAMPGGYIFVTRGMMALMGSEAELASVLGHEIGHVSARHSVSMMSRAQVAQIGLGIGSILSPGLAQFSELAGGGLSLLFLSYGRDAERQADDLGFRYALQDGYDVREMVHVFTSLQRSGELAGASPLPLWLSSHPYPEERIQRIQQEIDALKIPLADAQVGTDVYLAHLDSMAFGTNPRLGYFEGSHFFHPDLAFQLTFPAGWRTSNLPQAVLAGSPDQDAVIELTPASGSPNDAANAFFRQEGITPSQLTTRKINGLKATIGRFQAATSGGQISGQAAFIRHGETTFRLLAYTPTSRLSRYDAAFGATLGSFARLKDRAALAKESDRMKIERTEKKMTLAEFDETYPSVVSMDLLALLNQLSGPDILIPSGTLMKRIVNTR